MEETSRTRAPRPLVLLHAERASISVFDMASRRSARAVSPSPRMHTRT